MLLIFNEFMHFTESCCRQPLVFRREQPRKETKNGDAAEDDWRVYMSL